MDFQYVSDLHLEFYEDELNLTDIIIPVAKNLLLLGDIGYYIDNNYQSLIRQASQAFEKVFVILGNHEYYCIKGNINNLDNYVDIINQYNNVYFMNDSYLEFDDFIILGTTLWSCIPKDKRFLIEEKLGDMSHIVDWNVNKLNITHHNSVIWLKNTLNSLNFNNKPIIVCSHHIPSYNCISKKYLDHPMNCGYASKLDYIMKKYPIKYWFCGHSHYSIDKTIFNTRVLSNPRGYPENNNVNYENDKYSKTAAINM